MEGIWEVWGEEGWVGMVRWVWGSQHKDWEANQNFPSRSQDTWDHQ